MRKESKHNIEENHQNAKEEKEKERNREEPQNSQKTVNKMAISIYLSMMNLNDSCLNSPVKKIKWLNI